MEPPRKLSTDTRSPIYDPIFVKIGVQVDGIFRIDVHEYDMDEGYVIVREREGRSWRKDAAGRIVTRRIDTMDIKPYFRKDDTKLEERVRNDAYHIEQARLKRQRKAAKQRGEI